MSFKRLTELKRMSIKNNIFLEKKYGLFFKILNLWFFSNFLTKKNVAIFSFITAFKEE